MQFTLAFASTILAFASGISALPTTTGQVTIRIFNDQTGANADATVYVGAAASNVVDLFRGTALDSGLGNVFGTSAQLTTFSDTTKCSLVNQNTAGWVIDLDGRAKNFVDLDGDVTRPVPIWLNGFTFQCTQA